MDYPAALTFKGPVALPSFRTMSSTWASVVSAGTVPIHCPPGALILSRLSLEVEAAGLGRAAA